MPSPNPQAMRRIAIALCLFTCVSYGQKTPSQKTELPKVVYENGNHNLIVDGKPFLMLGAQLWNSSAWPFITEQFWPQFKTLNANTLEAPIYWQNIEPQPGQ